MFNKLNVWPHTVNKQGQNEKFYNNFVQFGLKIRKNNTKLNNLINTLYFKGIWEFFGGINVFLGH